MPHRSALPICHRPGRKLCGEQGELVRRLADAERRVRRACGGPGEREIVGLPAERGIELTRSAGERELVREGQGRGAGADGLSPSRRFVPPGLPREHREQLRGLGHHVGRESAPPLTTRGAWPLCAPLTGAIPSRQGASWQL